LTLDTDSKTLKIIFSDGCRFRSTSSLHSTANKSKSLAAAAAESRQSKAAVTELDGSAPKSKYREQFLKKMQRDSMSHRDSMSQQGE